MTIQITRLDRWIDPCFDEILNASPGMRVQVCKRADPAEINWPILSQTDIYQIPAARDEVPLEWQATPELLARCPRLKIVASTGAGYDTIDVDACTAAGILVLNQSGGNADSVAEHTLGFLLALSCRMLESDRTLKSDNRKTREDLMGCELQGKTLGLVGIGHIGSRVARLARAFSMQVLAYDPYLDAATIEERGATPVSLEELLARSDMVSLHCPRNKNTLGLFGREQFASMKRGAYFISTARGGIHDEDALYDALTDGHLAGAAVDVWKVEPPPPDHPLLGLPNVVASWHTAGVTHEARRRVAAMAAQQILDVCKGKRPPCMVNPEVFESVVRKFAG